MRHGWLHARCLLPLLLTLAGHALAQPAPAAQEAGDARVREAREVGEPDEAQMTKLARETLARWQDPDPARELGMRFRLQLVAGQPAEALASLQALRVLRPSAADDAPLFLQHELHARALLAQRQAQPAQQDYASTWHAAFVEQFAALSDRAAWRAAFAFGTSLARLRAERDAALARSAGRTELPLPEAIELLRAWQVHQAYAAFQPLFAQALRADDMRRYQVERERLVPTRDGAHLSTLVLRPRGGQALTTLYTHTIYAQEDWAWDDARRAAAHGYAGVVSFTRGKGASRDRIVPFRHEGPDAAAVIDWIAAQPWSDGRVGMYGGSYSGFTAWAAAKQRPKALKAIAASATAAPGIDVPMEGNVFLNFMFPWPHYVATHRGLDELQYGDAERWSRLNRHWYASGRAYRALPAIDGHANPWWDEWLRHPAYDTYWQRLIPQGAEFAGLDLPVFATTGYFDGAQIGALHYFREHLRARPDANHRLLVGPFGHLAMQTGVAPVVSGHSTDPSARIDLQVLRLAWFDHVLRGAPLPPLLAGRINWQVMGANRWRHADSLEAMPSTRRRVHLVPGRLSDTAQPGVHSLQTVDFRDRRDAAWTAPEGAVLQALPAQAGLVFESDVLGAPLELAGALAGELHLRVNRRDVDLALSVFERNAQGEYLELAWWLQRASHAEDRRQRRLLVPGAVHRIALRDTRLLGRRMAAGSRLVVTLGAVKQPDRQLNLGSGKDPADETLRDAGQPLRLRILGSSFLDLPVRAE